MVIQFFKDLTYLCFAVLQTALIALLKVPF
jgi:hypothetical protein